MKRGLASPNVTSMFERARVNLGDVVQTIYQPLYDYQTYAAAGAASQLFFQVPQGQAGKTIVDTNMNLAGNLPKGQAFAVTGLQVEFLPGVAIDRATSSSFADDMYTVLQTGALRFEIGSKAFVTQGNLLKFSPVNRLAGVASTGLVTQQIQYFQSCGREFAVADLLLESSQNFSVELIGLAATPSTAPGRIGVTLNGYLFRNAQ